MLDTSNIEISITTDTNESPPPEIRGKDIISLIQRTKDKIETDPPETNKVNSEWLPNIYRLQDALGILEGLTDPELNEITLPILFEDYRTFKLNEEDLFYIKLQHQAEQAKKYEIESAVDVLTELPNRRKFFSELEKSVQSVLITHLTKLLTIEDHRENPSTGIVVAITDLDHFKTLNEGVDKNHLYGDKKLKDFARLLEKIFRRPINIGRMGGDEFGISLEITSYTENSIDKIMESFEERRTSISSNLMEIVMYRGESYTAGTLSMGIAYFPGMELVHELKTQVYKSSFSPENKKLLTKILDGKYGDIKAEQRLKLLENCIELLSTKTGQEIISQLTNSVVYNYADNQEKKAKQKRNSSVKSIYESTLGTAKEPTTPSPTPV